MKFLITGGEGFVGSALCHTLAERCHEVTSIDNHFNNCSRPRHQYVDYIVADCKDILNTHLKDKSFDYIFHLGEYARVEQSFDDDGDNLLSGSVHSDSDLEYESNAASPSLLSSQRIVEGVSGPEDVVLEVIAGVTQVDFNELCDIQDGSLIELQSHTLPMVKLAVRGVPILEGELVRFKEVLMVQVTRRISNGSRDD